MWNIAKTMLLCAFRVLPLLFLFGCTLFKDQVPNENSDENLITLNAKGKTVLLGSLPSGGRSYAQFDYNFKLGKFEVTVDEFRTIMGFLPSQLLAVTDDDLPVSYVNLYDAVRYCNALSIKRGYDTVYQYTNLELALNGQTSTMEGLSADFSKNGYRIPTEAEWLFAARQESSAEFSWGSDTATDIAEDYSWTSQNSNWVAHPVGTKKASKLGFYDLTGNIQELIWGYWGVFRPDTVKNYVGPMEASVEPQVVVKGGSFAHSLSAGKNSARKDVYTVYPSTRLIYLGFRVGRAAIPDPTYSDGKGGTIEGTPFTVSASRKDIQQFFKTTRLKIAFVNASSGSLASIDFSPYGFSLRESKQGVNVANPTFSPDGKHLAYATRYEGQAGKSEGYLVQFPGDTLQRLFTDKSAYRPRWWVDPKTENWWIVVGDSGVPNSDTERWEKGTTRAVAWRNAPDQILTTSGSYHSGISTDGRYLVTGYTRLVRFDKENGESKELFLSPQNGKDSAGSTQACNVSVRPGSDPQILFLDFGYPRKSSITGGSYGIHEYLFFANMQTGRVEKYFKVPNGYTAWGYSLWSNHPNYLVAAVTDGTDAHKAIYAIRYSDGAMLKIAEGADLIMPSLWVDSASVESGQGLREDYGRYDQPEGLSTMVWNAKMVPFWTTHGTRDAFIFGTSREWAGLDPLGLPEYKFLNMAGPAIGAYAGIEWSQYYLKDSEPPRLVILGIGPEFGANFTLPWFKNSMGLSPGFAEDKANNFWVDSLPSDDQKALIENGKLGRDYALFETEELGFHSTGICGEWGEPLLNIDDTWEKGKSSWGEGWAYLKQYVTNANKMGTRVATVIMPMNPKYRNTPYYSRHGGLRKEVLQFLDSVKSLEKGNPDFRHFDFHHDGNHDFKDNEAADTDHLCPRGALRVTDSLRQALKQWDSE